MVSGRAHGALREELSDLVGRPRLAEQVALHLGAADRLQRIELQVEQSFDELGPTRYGQPVSVRTDAILRNAQGVIIAIYEVKTGEAEMRPSTKQKYRDYTKIYPAVQIFILRAQRGQR